MAEVLIQSSFSRLRGLLKAKVECTSSRLLHAGSVVPTSIRHNGFKPLNPIRSTEGEAVALRSCFQNSYSLKSKMMIVDQDQHFRFR